MKENFSHFRFALLLDPVRLLAIAGLLVPLLENSLKAQDLSNTNSVTISLGGGREGRMIGGNGLRHLTGAGGDARTAPMDVQGVACSCLDPTAARFPKAYLPFSIDPAFKGGETSHVRVEVEYFDGLAGHAGVFGLQYDATGVGKGQEPRYQPCYPNVGLRGSQKWNKATFHIKGAAFQNSQNGGADFRLWASPPELCVKRVTVTLEPEGQAPKETPVVFNADGEGTLGEWYAQWDSGARPLFASNVGSGKEPRWLEVRAPGTFGAGSWRTTAFLEAGDYQFVGKARTQGLQGGGGQTPGVSLRISFHRDGQVLPEAPDWTQLSYDFTMPERAYVEFICAVRGDQGNARLDPDSLKLIRKKPRPAP